MNCLTLGVLLLVFSAAVCSGAEVSESDVVRVFDPNLKLSKEVMFKILKKANLEKAGFKKTVENTTETDENGEKNVKKTIHYMVKDDCARVGYWEGVLEQRLPKKFFSSNVGLKFVREIQSRVKGRDPKYCEIGLEIHLNRCRPNSSGSSQSTKRSARCGWWTTCPCNNCFVCNSAKIVY